MTRIVAQLLAFARRGSIERAPVDLARIARQTLSLVGPLMSKSGVELDLATSGDAVAHVDELQMQQALTNLVMNAVQAMPAGGRIEVSVRRAEDALVQVRVADEGTGIEPEHLARIFDPFFTTKDTGQGTGLGLSIAEKIVRDHGGWIAVASERGKGSVFDVFLPANGVR